MSDYEMIIVFPQGDKTKIQVVEILSKNISDYILASRFQKKLEDEFNGWGDEDFDNIDENKHIKKTFFKYARELAGEKGLEYIPFDHEDAQESNYLD